jgi:hypothetical protein
LHAEWRENRLTLPVLEHDGSLSRSDIYFGDNISFNETVWESTASHFTESTISIKTAAKARKERIEAAAAVNPEFSLPAAQVQISLIETALYLSVFGNTEDGNAKTEWVRTLFGKLNMLIISEWS